MKVFKGIQQIKEKLDYPVLTIGNFDGVHIGHQDIIRKVVEKAREKNGTSIVMIFDPHPRTLFFPENPLKQISTMEQRLALIERLGVDVVVIENFTNEFASIEPERFVSEYLVNKLEVTELFLSSKFRFGKNASGGIDLLRDLSVTHEFKLDVVENIFFRHTVVSSSFIRQSILDGEMEIARLMLGRPYTLYGEVYPDTQRGTNLLNTPTSNIKPLNELIPALGIYAAAVQVENKSFPAATYIGTRPTFGGDHVVIESHIIGYSGSLYGEDIKVALFKKTRNDKKFEHLTELLYQIRQDVKDVEAYFDRHKSEDFLSDLIWNNQN